MDTVTGIGTTVAGFLSDLGTMASSVIGWCGDVLDFITSNPVVIVPALMFFVVGGCVGIIHRLMRG